MVRNRINYLGRCDLMIVNEVAGTVTARLEDPDRAEEIRCKFEVAGLAEIRSNMEMYREKSRQVAKSCMSVAEGASDVELKQSLRWLSIQEF